MAWKIIKIVTYVLIGFILTLILLSYIFEDEIKDGLKTELNERFNAKVDFDDINLSLIRSFPDALIEIERFTVDGIDHFEGTRLFESKLAQIDVSIPSLIRKSTPYRIKEVNIDEPHLHLLVKNDSLKNYLITKSSDSEIQYTIALDDYYIKNGELTYQDEMTDMEFSARNITHQGSGNFTQDIFDLHTITATDSLQVYYSGIPYLVNSKLDLEADIEVNLPEEKYTFQENKGSINALDFVIDGYLQFTARTEGMTMDFNFSAPEADFQSIFSLVPYAYTKDYDEAQISGTGDIMGYIKGNYSSIDNQLPSFGIDVQLNQGSIQYPLLPSKIYDVFLKASIKNDPKKEEYYIADVPLFRFKMNNDNFDGSLQLEGNQRDAQINASLETNLQLASWKQALPLENVHKLNGKMSGSLDLRTSLQDIRNKNWKDIFFNCDFMGKNIDIESEDWPVIKADEISMNATSQKMDLAITQAFYGQSDFNSQLTINQPLNYLIEKEINGEIIFTSKSLRLEDFITNQTESSLQSNIIIPPHRLTYKANLGEVSYDGDIYSHIDIKGSSSNNEINLTSFHANYQDNDVNLSGTINDYMAYLNGQDKMKGQLVFTSNSLNLDDFIQPENSNKKSADRNDFIPSNIDIDIQGNIAELKYGEWTLKNIASQIKVAEDKAEVQSFQSSSLGGIIQGSGIFEELQENKSSVSLRIDLKKIQFSNAFQSVKTFRYLAPLAKYMEGFLNSTLIMEVDLDKGLTPQFQTLNASGYLETLDGSIAGFPPLENLGSRIGLEELKNWTITNTRNWFEVVDGMVELKDHTFSLGQDISATIGGRHGLGKNMDYKILLEIPREYLRKNAITGTLDSGFKMLEDKASQLGINLNQGAYVLINVNMSGSIENPSFKITPVGTSGKKLDEMAKEELKRKEEEILKKVSEEAKEFKEGVVDTLSKKQREISDTITKVFTEKTQKVKDSIESKIQQQAGEKLDSLIDKTGLDSNATQVIDILKEKTGKDVDDIKNKLEKWNPFKKKKAEKTDTSKTGVKKN